MILEEGNVQNKTLMKGKHDYEKIEAKEVFLPHKRASFPLPKKKSAEMKRWILESQNSWLNLDL